MLAKLVIVSFLLSSILSLDLFPDRKISNAPLKEVTQDITTAYRESSKTVSETSRSNSGYNDIPQKNTCPPIDNFVSDDPDYKECDEIKNIADITPHPDQNKTTPEILETYGYSYMEYGVRTKDGYILTVFRITGSPKLQKGEAHMTPVYLNHGLLGSTDWWFFVSHEKSLPFMMSNEGYDVWLSNARGNSYSFRHETLKQKNLSYWEFSFHEMGMYDIPAVTDMILKETDRESLIYVGYSMGATQILITLSELPEMNNKIRPVFLLAPVAYMGHSPSILRNVATAGDTEEMYCPVNVALRGRLRSNEDIRKMLGASDSSFCVTSATKCGLCDNLLFALFGVNPPQLNRSSIPMVMAKAPNIASWKTMAHYGQLMTSCRFQKFEYTPANNLKKYGSLRPPLYNLKNVKSPLYIYYGAQDLLGIPLDTYETVRRFKPGVVQELIRVPDPLFTHLDFQTAKDVDKLVYTSVLSHAKKYIEYN